MIRRFLLIAVLLCPAVHAIAQEHHDHPAPEKLGKVSFATSCKPDVQPAFNRAVALLHSFAYSAAEKAFQQVAERDPSCAMAHWGVAMTYFHQLWEPQVAPAVFKTGAAEVAKAEALKPKTAREQQFISALAKIYADEATPYHTRLDEYEAAMKQLAGANADTESQVFYALALLASAPPTDKTHSKQKKAAGLLEPIHQQIPQHPGVVHYLIHAYDNTELANHGVKAAREYAKIAPSAPHALHMPSHIFTRLGLWDDSIASNTAARKAAHDQGDTGEELHAMDYLVYAYLQAGHDAEAKKVLDDLGAMNSLTMAEFKIGYAATAMPIRYVVERGKWEDAARISAPESAPPQVKAIAVWARGLGLARTGHAAEAREQAAKLRELSTTLRDSGSGYWASQAGVLENEVRGWAAEADGKHDEAAALLRQSADQEDSTEKLPVTPGPILPAREQLGELLMDQKNLSAAAKEFSATLESSPGRRRSLAGAKLTLAAVKK